MLAVKSMDVRENFKEWCNKVIGGETLIVSRPKNENVVIISEKEYNEMAKARRNAEYPQKSIFKIFSHLSTYLYSAVCCIYPHAQDNASAN